MPYAIEPELIDDRSFERMPGSFKVTDFGTSDKPTHDFPLLNNASFVSCTVSQMIGQIFAVDRQGTPV